MLWSKIYTLSKLLSPSFFCTAWLSITYIWTNRDIFLVQTPKVLVRVELMMHPSLISEILYGH